MLVKNKNWIKTDHLSYISISRCSPPPQSHPNNPTERIYLIIHPNIKSTNKLPITWDYLSPKDTGVVDLGAFHIYISLSAPHGPPDTTTSTVCVGTATGQVHQSSATSFLLIPHLGNDFPTTGHIVPNSTNTFIGFGPICDAKCTVLFTN